MMMKSKMLMGLLATVCLPLGAQNTEPEGFYPINFPQDQVSAKSGNKITGITLECATSGTQTATPRQDGTNQMYRDMLSTVMNVVPGETIQPRVTFSANWMNAYLYIDRADDGQFDVAADISQENPLPDCDLMAYSYIETDEAGESGFNALGQTVTKGSRSTLAMPAFTLPADMQPGMYRMRVKVDWGDADPAGRMTATNNIVANGGQIVDLMLNVHGETGFLTQSGENGTILLADGETAIDRVPIPFATPLTVCLQPAQDYVAGGVTVRYGHRVQGEQYVHGNPQWQEVTLPAMAVGADGRLNIPAGLVLGDVHLISHFIEEGQQPEKGDYPLNFDPAKLKNQTADRAVSSVTFTSAEGQNTVGGWTTKAPFPVYADATDQLMHFKAGETITPSCLSANNTWMYAYVYIDYNHNGYFDLDAEPAELVTQTPSGESYASIPSFTLPAWLPDGDYRVRFKTDWNCDDPGGRYGEGYTRDFIDTNRGQIIDFTLRIDSSLQPAALREETEHCNLYTPDGQQLPATVRGVKELRFKVVPMENYVLSGTLDVVSEAGTVSFDELPEDGILTAPIQGNTLIRAHFQQGPEATWTCIFNDEFNKDNYTWDSNKWIPRPLAAGVTWARFNSQQKSDSVCVQNNGYLSLTTKTTGSNTMVTGNLTTEGRCNFTYGRVEARCKVYPWTGNFPAFWMMPAAQKPNYSGSGTWGGWPHSGEIDIMEQINWENRAYQTIHTHYANGANEGGLGQTYQKSGSCWVDMYDKWHIYALEWDKEQLRWYVDGKHVHTYDRIPAKDNDNDRQWPYDRPFYILINQSVGNGGWAASPDFGHQYRMDVDYVRVYQRCTPTSVTPAVVRQGMTVRAGEGRIILQPAAPTRVGVSNLSGTVFYSGLVSEITSIPLPAGIYVVAGQKVVVK